jgi:hypothetical protein
VFSIVRMRHNIQFLSLNLNLKIITVVLDTFAFALVSLFLISATFMLKVTSLVQNLKIL